MSSTARNTLDRINFELALEILRMKTDFVVETLRRAQPRSEHGKTQRW
jgi:hypothetical protein